MKRQTIWYGVLVSLALFVLVSDRTSAQNYGEIRALKLRATAVSQQKNHFVARVLNSYKIPYQRNEQGIVLRLHIDDRWYDVHQMEIVPVTQQEENGFHVVAHEIFFYTDGDILHLVSALTIP
jgi:hypothetical protein